MVIGNCPFLCTLFLESVYLSFLEITDLRCLPRHKHKIASSSDLVFAFSGPRYLAGLS